MKKVNGSADEDVVKATIVMVRMCATVTIVTASV